MATTHEMRHTSGWVKVDLGNFENPRDCQVFVVEHSSYSRVKANTRLKARQDKKRTMKEDCSQKFKYVRCCIIILVAASRPLHLVNGQVSDGDDQFQAYHQDIGRISGSASRATVAAPTQTVLLRQPEPLNDDESDQRAPVAPAPAPAPVLAPARARSSQAASSRKPNRITLAVRTHAPVQVITDPAIVSPSQPVESSQQSPFTPLAAPTGQYQSTQFQPLAPIEPVVASNQRSSSLANSVSARHSALMAQVAAERGQQGSSTLLESHGPAQDTFQPASQSPSPSSAVVSAQVQSPPFLFQHQNQNQNQQQAAASPALTFVDQPEEPLVAPSFEQVLSRGCPPKGIFSWENKDYCDRYYMCTNGTFTEEACPNGLGYSQMGAVYQHCAYNWNVDCGTKKTAQPLASAGCPWQFGIFPVSSAVGRCSIDYYVCEWGVPETKRCSPEGLFYDDRIKGCQWADQLGCKSEALLNFKCPPEDEDNPYWPYPRYYHTKQDVIVCVNEQPRLVHCTEEQAVDPGSLACIDLKPKKLKKKLS